MLLYCRADIISIQLMLGAFYHFSEVSGLRANLDKSSLYAAGTSHAFRNQLILELHFAPGTIPFKYLSSRKFVVHQCMPPVDRIVAKIRCWTGNFLSL